MSKKQAYYDIAQKMYIEEQKPISGIAERLDITEKTLRDWKIKGDWETKKLQLIKSQQSCHAELYKLVEKLTAKMSEDIEAGEKPDASTLYFLKGMIDKLPKLKAYEDSVSTKQKEVEVSAEDLVSKVNGILGV